MMLNNNIKSHERSNHATYSQIDRCKLFNKFGLVYEVADKKCNTEYKIHCMTNIISEKNPISKQLCRQTICLDTYIQIGLPKTACMDTKNDSTQNTGVITIKKESQSPPYTHPIHVTCRIFLQWTQTKKYKKKKHHHNFTTIKTRSKKLLSAEARLVFNFVCVCLYTYDIRTIIIIVIYLPEVEIIKENMSI